MNAYFTRLFNYDYHTSLVMIDLMAQCPELQKPVDLMAHTLTAQLVWLKRCKGEPAHAGALWPDWPADSLAQIAKGNHAEWVAFVENLQPEDYERIITYKTIRGEAHQNKLADIIAHVINHGTHHRSQIGQHIKSTGMELPLSDYILYIRELELQ